MKNVKDIYRLSPTQREMLIYTLYAPGEGANVEQLHWAWRGAVDADALERAWARVVERHTVLRTAFAWEGMAEPVQAVLAKVDVRLARLDWRGLAGPEQAARLADYLEGVRREGFKLSAAPLMRLALIRLGPEAYRFVWSYHHILLDGWSVPLCLREVLQFYRAFCRGQDVDLGPARPYREYIAWLAKQDADAARRHWVGALAGLPAPAPVPLARRAAGGRARYLARERRLSEGETAKLAAAAREYRVTLSTLVQGAWALLLGRYLGRDDVLFGLTVAGRPVEMSDVDTMVGLFINTLPVRVRVDRGAEVAAWLRALQADQMAARRHTPPPVSELRNLVRQKGEALFDSVVVVENFSDRGLFSEAGRDAGIDDVCHEVSGTGLPLALVVSPGAELDLRLTYDASRFEDDALDQLLGHFCALLGGLAGGPTARLGDLDMLSAEERGRAIVAWNATDAPREGGQSVHGAFEAQARRTPDATAVVAGGAGLSYRELDGRADRLAWHLRRFGAGPGARVAVCLPRTADLIVALLAVLKAGAAYVPLDPTLPPERLAFVARDAGVGLQVTSADLLPGALAEGVRVVRVDRDAGAIASEAPRRPAEPAGGEAPAYVIYTSGSTGLPKGVLVPHRAVLNHSLDVIKRFGLSPADLVLQFATVGFDAAVEEIFPTLLSGGALVMHPEPFALSVPEMLDFVGRQGVTALNLPTAYWHVLTGEIEREALSLPPALRLVVVGGEQASAPTLASWRARAGADVAWINTYGPTEATVTATAFALAGGASVEGEIPIGRPIENVRAYVLDPHMGPQPVGVPGELMLGGAGVATGYLGRPALTAERFVPDPFGPPGARLYRTGDGARWRPDGQLEYVGRLDRQVKLRGFRVELGEIEAAVLRHGAAREAAVLLREDRPGDRRLVAYVVARPGHALDAHALRAQLERSLPPYMVPSAVVPLDALPLTPNGKLDRGALPAPEEETLDRPPYLAPRTDVERSLAEIFAQLLGVERVGVDDDFFALGGHSLAATQLASRVRRAFGVEVPLRVLFEASSVAALAGHLEGRAGAGEAPPAPRPVPRGGPLPLSFAQQRLWFLDQLEPGRATYNLPVALRLEGALDVGALGRAFGEVVHRHEALRTTFEERDGVAVQRVGPAPEGPFDVAYADLTGLPAAAREAAARERLTAEAARPFDLTRGPLLRAHLLRLSEREHWLLVTMHHIASDGWSIGVLVREVGELYAALGEGRPAALPALPVQYADYAAWQREWLRGEALERQLAYWREELSGVPPALEIATDRPRPAQRSGLGDVVRVRVPAESAAALQALCRAEGATLFMGLLAAFQVLLHRHGGQRDFCVGTPAAGRNRAELEPLVGFFVNTLALRARFDGRPSFREVLARARQATLGAYDHQDVPFEALVDALQPQRDRGRTPLVQAVLAMQNVPPLSLRAPSLAIGPLEFATGTAKFDLTLSLFEAGGGLEGWLEYSTDLFERATAERLAERFAGLVREAAAAPDRPVAALPLLGDDEGRRLAAWGGSAHEGALPGRSLHGCFEARAASAPDAVAVSFEGATLTYGELDARAARLARRLRALGVGPGSLVGLCVERSPDLVVGVLGILKAGGAYLPLDPSYPPERLGFMIEDSALRVLVTQGRARAALPAHGAAVVALDDEGEGEGGRAPHGGPDAPASGPHDLAYVIYTSGSTGRPKGVLITHGHVLRLFRAAASLYDFGRADVWTLFHSYAFDFSVWELWGALLYGGRLVVVPYDVSRSPEAFYGLLGREQVTVLNQTPSAFRQLVQHEQSLDAPGLGSLRYVIFGGEALEFATLGPWFGRRGGGGPRLVNMYGITETTVHVTYRALDPEDAGARASSIGRPMPGWRAYVLDGELAPAPIGVPGELYVGGDGVARGYLGRPALTAERFVPDPFSKEPGARLYRTGDGARWRPDGQLEYVGRLDGQIKLRGFRVELGEIEAVLARHPSVYEAAALLREDRPGDRRLVAYVAAREPVTPAALRAFARERLPEYMVPSAVVALDALPLTPNGKLDRKALPAPGLVPAAAPKALPAGAEEEAVAAAFAHVLGLPEVGADDDFFELGGDSIQSIRVVAKAAQGGAKVSVAELFEHRTPRALARLVRARPSGEAPAAKIEPFGLLSEADRRLLPDGVEDAYPMTALQLGMVFHGDLSPSSLAYHNVNHVLLRAPFDAARLAGALAEAFARHPALRASFALAGYSEPLQLIHRSAPPPLEVEDLRDVGVGAQRAALEAFYERECARRFDYARAPLARFTAQRLSDEAFRLCWAEHHAVLDGWSVHALLVEIFERYAAPAGRADGPHDASFREYVALERAARRDDQSRAFFERALDGHAFAPLPRWPGAKALSGPGAPACERPVPLPAGCSRALKAAAARAAVPVKSVLLAAHGRVLSALTGRGDVVTGLAFNGRPEVEGGERVLGLFLNSLPLRLRLDAGGSWLDLAREAFAQERKILPHRRYPLPDVQRARGGRDFDVLFNFTHFHVLGALTGRDDVEVLESGGVNQTSFPLTVEAYVDHATGEVKLSLRYDPSELPAEQVDAIAGHYAATLEALGRDPEARHEDAPLLSEAELRRVSFDWAVAAALPVDACVDELVARQAALTPEAVAIGAGGREVTYRELEARAGALAGRLAVRGAGPGRVVAVLVERSAELVVALLAVLKTGAAYLPLDVDYPPERLAFMLEDSGAAVALTSAPLAGRLPRREGLDLVLLEGGEGEPADGRRPPARDAGQLAYIMYTSGSTGRPKGVAVPHRAVVRLVRDGSFARWAPPQVVLQLAPAAFDASTFEIWGALANGARLAPFPPGELTFDALGDFLRRERVTTAWLTAGLFHGMAEHAPDALGGLEQLLAGGDTLSAAHVRALLEAHPRLRLVNGYGPTENTTFTACHVLGPGGEALEAGAGAVPIGRPIANTRAYVLDWGMRPAPVGAAGELYAGGDGLAWGYPGRPALTAERFVPDPFGPPGARLYRTGDGARWRPDGRLDFLGRLDQQVKVRGYRVEPGEIEAALLSLPEVGQAAVLLREDTPGAQHLVAYVVAAPGRTLDPEAVRASLRGALPAFMVPSAVVPLDALPLTPNGKLDRKALPAPSAAPPDAAYVAPRTPLERTLAAAFAEVLGRTRVGVHDDFFALGGHSLAATRLVARLRAELGAELPLRALFEGPTVAGLVSRLARLPQAADGPPPLRPVPRDGPLPLSFAQQRLWFLDRLEPGRATYNVPAAFRLEGALDVAALERALNEVVRRHEILRTTFDDVEGVPSQRIHPAAPAPLPLDDCAAAAEGGEAAARRAAADEFARPFDLGRGAPLRARLLRLGEREHWLLVTMHHIATDGWSVDVFVGELARLYQAFSRGEPSPLGPLPVQYADYAAWQRHWLEGGALERQLAHWRRELEGAEPLDLPTDLARPAVRTRRGGAVPVRVPRALAERLGELARAEGATAFMLLLAAFEALLSRLSGQRDLCVGTPIAGRTRAETEGLIGFFVNTLVLRARLTPSASFRELLRQTRATALAAFENQDLPFEKLVEELAPDRSLSRTPLFQAFFALQNAPATPSLPGLSLRALPADVPAAKFDLSLSLSETPAGFEGAFEYSADLFDARTVRHMADRFLRLLEGASRSPDRPLAELPLLTEAERRALLDERNATAADFPRGACLHHLVEAAARNDPAAVALACGDERWSYSRLEARANRLARRLLALGVGPEVRVGVLLERSCELASALLAVLKAGGAYVPLDPEAPPDRLAFLLEDANVRVLLTDARAERALPKGGPTPTLVRVDGPLPGPEAPAPAPDGGAREDNLAYVLYTSGSTGRPKGVLVSHRALVNHMRWIVDAYGLGPADRLLQKTSLAFDASVWECWAPLITGGLLAFAPPGAHRDPAALAAALARHEITVLQTVPTALHALLDEASLASATRLRLLFCGGEPLPHELGARLRGALPGARLVNLYGPTEATIDATSAPWVEDDAGGTVPLGRPIANARCYALGEALELLPDGTPGELYIGGAGVARGYLNRPALTAERFVPDPFSKEPGARLYRTGDRVRFRPDGQLEYLGRLDDQIKLRGHRIEPGEIEAALLQQPGVLQAAARLREDRPGDRRLVAYVVARPGHALDAHALRAQLERSLPPYMVPSAVVPLDALPLTAGGKIDRKALPAPAMPTGAAGHAPPRDRVEFELTSIYEELLGVRPVGVRDDFFALGGHSLLAVQLLARVERRLGRRLRLDQLFGGATIEALTASLREAHPDLPRSPRLALQAKGARPPVFGVHAVGGSPLSLLELARALGEDQPFYAFQAPGIDGDEAPLDTVEGLAERYLAFVDGGRRGDFWLAGWSFGGLVAYEMARRLEASGRAPAGVLLLDSWLPGGDTEPPAEDDLLGPFAREFGIALSPAELDALGRAGQDERFALLGARAEAQGVLPPGSGEAHLRRHARVYGAHLRAFARYRPAVSGVRLTLLRPAEAHAGGAELSGLDPTGGWARLSAAPVEVLRAPGDHFSMLRAPHVAQLAQIVGRVLGAKAGEAPREGEG